MAKKISFGRTPGGEPVDVSSDGKTTTYADGTKVTRPEDGASPEPGKTNAISFGRTPGGEQVKVSPDGKTTTYADGTKVTRP